MVVGNQFTNFLVTSDNLSVFVSPATKIQIKVKVEKEKEKEGREEGKLKAEVEFH